MSRHFPTVFTAFLGSCALLLALPPAAAQQSGGGKKEAPSYAPSVPEPTRAEVAYGERERQVLDFWRAESEKPTPVAFVIHPLQR